MEDAEFEVCVVPSLFSDFLSYQVAHCDLDVVATGADFDCVT